MGNQIFSWKNFKIYHSGENYIVHNSKVPFKEGHTHISDFNTAKYIVYLAVKKKVPKNFSAYLFESLIRISTDMRYIRKLQAKMCEVKSNGLQSKGKVKLQEDNCKEVGLQEDCEEDI